MREQSTGGREQTMINPASSALVDEYTQGDDARVARQEGFARHSDEELRELTPILDTLRTIDVQELPLEFAELVIRWRANTG